MLAKARRLGCKPEQYTLTVLLLEVHDLPASYDDALVAVELFKSKKQVSSAASKKAGEANCLKSPARTPASWASRRWGDAPLELKLTLYRDSKNSFLQKPFLLRLLDESPGAQGKPLAEFTMDAGAFVRPGGAPTRARLNAAPKSSRVKNAAISVAVACRFENSGGKLTADKGGASDDYDGRSDASESLARVDDSDLSGFTILEESVDSGGSGGGENGGDDGDDDDDDDKDRLSDSDAHDRFKALLNDVDDLLKAKPEATTSDPLPEEGSTHSSNSSQLPPISDASSKAPESSEGGGDVAALVAAAETEALRAELLAVKSAAAMERAAHDQRVRELESTVERLSVASPSSNRNVSSPTYSGGSGKGGYDRYSFNGTFGRGLGAGSGGYLMPPSEMMSPSSEMGSPGMGSPGIGNGADERQRRHSMASTGSSSGGGGGMPMSPLKSGAGFDRDDSDPWNLAGGTIEYEAARDAAMLELSRAADHACLLPPEALVGQWITVEGKGLGKVLAFHKRWKPGTNSLHTIQFSGKFNKLTTSESPSSSSSSSSPASSATKPQCLDLLLRRPKISKVRNWGTGAMNGGLLFALARAPSDQPNAPNASPSPAGESTVSGKQPSSAGAALDGGAQEEKSNGSYEPEVIFSPAEVSSLRASWVGNNDDDDDSGAVASSSSSTSVQRRGSQRSAWSDLDDVGFGNNNRLHNNHNNGSSGDSPGAAEVSDSGSSGSSSTGGNGQQSGIVRNLGFSDNDNSNENGASTNDDGGEAAAAVAERFRQRSLQRQSSKLAESLPEGWAAELDPTTQRYYFVNLRTQESQWEAPTRDGD